MMDGNLQLLHRADVKEFLDGSPVGHLATAGSNGAPHNVPLCFCCEGESFYFVIDRKPKRKTGTGLKRMRNIAENPQVSLVVDHYEANWRNLAYVMIQGRARVVEDRREYDAILLKLRAKYLPYQTMALNFDENPIVRIDPDRVHIWGVRFDAPAAGASKHDSANPHGGQR